MRLPSSRRLDDSEIDEWYDKPTDAEYRCSSG